MPHERKEHMKLTRILHKSAKPCCKKAGNVVVSLMDLTISKTKCRRAKALRPLRFAEKPPLVVARASQRVYMCHMSFGRKQEVLQVRQPIRSSTVKRLIVVLAILLALSLAALCAVRYYGRQAGRAAEAPGNGIQTAHPFPQRPGPARSPSGCMTAARSITGSSP